MTQEEARAQLLEDLADATSQTEIEMIEKKLRILRET